MSRFLPCAAALLLAAGPAFAQVQQLPALTVTAPAEAPSLTVPSVEESRRILGQTAGSVGFIDAESFKDRYTGTLRDVLEETPGVYIQNRYGQELRLSVRGSGIGRAFHTRGIEILQDGIPFNLADGSGDFYQVDPLALRSTEVYRGGNGLAYGASTLGGAINFVTPTAQTAIAPNILRLEGGSGGTGRLNGQISREIGNFDLLAGLTTYHSEGYRDHSRGQGEFFNANGGYRFNSNVETRFYAGAYVVTQQLPGSLTLNEVLNAPRKATAAALAGNQARDSWTERVANRTSIKFDVGKLDVDTWVINKALFHPIFQVIDQKGWTYGVAPRYTGRYEIAGFRDDVILGGRFLGGNNDALQFINNAGTRGAQTANSRQDSYNYEGYAENRWFFLPSVALMTGAKLLRDERQYTDLINPRNSASRHYDGINPKLGLLWETTPDIQVFADVTRSLDVPDFSDLNQTQAGGAIGFVPLQAQRAYTFEAGTRGKLDRFNWDVTAYRSQIRGQMLQYTTAPNIPAATFNAGRTVVQGLELGVTADLVRDIGSPGDKVTLGQIWNYTDATFRGDGQYGNNRIAGLPEHVFRTKLSYVRIDGFHIAPIVDVVPNGAYADYANTLKVPAYMLLGAQAGMDFDNGLSLFLDARNLTNKRYVTDVGTITDARKVSSAVFYPGDGPSVYGGFRLAF